MNQIDITCAKLAAFSYPQYQISVDGMTINQYLNQHTKSKDFDLLLPPIGLVNEQDQQALFELLDCRNNVLPILVCSDDMDFSCIVVSTFVKEDKNCITWDFFGYGMDMSRNIYVPKLHFDKASYNRFIEKFKTFIQLPYSEFANDI